MKKLFLIPFLLISCQSQDYSKEKCEKLSMRSFRGIPNDAHKFKTGCQKYKGQLHYSQKKCKEAMNDLVLNGSRAYLEKKHGKDIIGCFNESDKKSFLKP